MSTPTPNRLMPLLAVALLGILLAGGFLWLVFRGAGGSAAQPAADSRYPLVTRGVFRDRDREIPFIGEYWGMTSVSENYVPRPGSGPQPWNDVNRRAADAGTFDELVALYTPESLADLEARRKLLEDSILLNQRRRAEGRPVRTIEQVYLTVRISVPAGQRWYVASCLGATEATACIPPEEAGPLFAVAIYLEAEGRLLRDDSVRGDPIRSELTRGRWKQFGAPQDFLVRKDIAERLAREAAAAATRPAPQTQPALLIPRPATTRSVVPSAILPSAAPGPAAPVTPPRLPDAAPATRPVYSGPLPARSEGRLLVDGVEVPYTLEYWAWQSRNGIPDSDVWAPVIPDALSTLSWEQYVALHTPESAAALEPDRTALERHRQAAEAGERPELIDLVIGCLVRTRLAGKDTMFVRLALVLRFPVPGSPMPPSAWPRTVFQRSAPFVLVKGPDGRWLCDLTLANTPFATILKSGRWRELGAPLDYDELPAPRQIPATRPSTRPEDRP
jgi:hypothetical protein